MVKGIETTFIMPDSILISLPGLFHLHIDILT